jgi:ubiquitin-conjugating enzyme E2 C
MQFLWSLSDIIASSVLTFLALSGYDVQTCGDPGISAFPEGDNIFSWIGTIKGSAATVYEGLSYKLTLKFPTDYPFKPPVVKFDTLCFHPNVDQFGNICLDILQVHFDWRFTVVSNSSETF